MKQNKAATLPFSDFSTFFNRSISIKTKSLLNPDSYGNQHNFVIFYLFCNYIVFVATPKSNVHYNPTSLIPHRIPIICASQKLTTDKRSEYLNCEVAFCSSLFNIRHSPRSSHAPWTNGLVGIKRKNKQTHLRMFLLDNPENWSAQVHFFAYVHNTQPLSHLHISP